MQESCGTARLDSAEKWDEIRLETIDFIEKVASTEPLARP